METVKIYFNTCTQSVMMSDQSSGFSLDPWGNDTDMIKGYDDGGKDYILPDGYELARYANQPGKGIFRGDEHCDIITHNCGRPQLISSDLHNMPVLKLA